MRVREKITKLRKILEAAISEKNEKVALTVYDAVIRDAVKVMESARPDDFNEMKQNKVYMKEAAEELILSCCLIRREKDDGDLECECGYCLHGKCTLTDKDGLSPCDWEVCE